MLRTLFLAAALAALCVLGGFSGCSEDCATCTENVIRGEANLNAQIIHPQPGPDYYTDLWVAGPSDVFVSASSGAVYRWQGSGWTRYDTGSRYRLDGIWGTSPSDVFAVGGDGTAVHFNGSTWSAVPTDVIYDLYDVWGNAANDVYAIGYYGLVLHYDGAGWSAVETGLPVTNRDFRTLWTSGSSIFTGGYGYIPNYTGLIRYFDGSSWTEASIGEEVVALWGFTPDSVYAGGRSGFLSKFNGGTWSTQTGPDCDVHALWGTTGDNLWAAGGHFNGSRWVGGLFNYDGSTWNQSSAQFDHYIDALGGAGENEVYLAGEVEQLARYDGANWTDINDYYITSKEFLTVWGSSETDVWLLGSGGAIYHFDGSALTDHSGVTDKTIYDAWGPAPNNIYAVGADGLVLNYNGVDWTEVATGLPPEYYQAVWGTSASDVWIGRENGMLAHFDGSSWSEHSIRNITNGWIVDLWGSAETNYYAVADGHALHYDGDDWSPLMLGSERIRAVHGASAGRVFFTAGSTAPVAAAGAGDKQIIGPPPGPGTLIVYDGSSYTTITTGFGGELSDVWALGPNNVFLTGRRGSAPSILHFNGHAVAAEEIPTIMWIDALWATGSGTAFAVGDRGLLVRATAN